YTPQPRMLVPPTVSRRRTGEVAQKNPGRHGRGFLFLLDVVVNVAGYRVDPDRAGDPAHRRQVSGPDVTLPADARADRNRNRLAAAITASRRTPTTPAPRRPDRARRAGCNAAESNRGRPVQPPASRTARGSPAPPRYASRIARSGSFPACADRYMA